jgi:hypothetical protein
MESLPKSERVRALQTLGVWCQMELTGTEPPKSVLEGLNFNSIKAMRIQIANWGFPGWLTSQNDRRRKVKGGAGNKSELPPAVAANHPFESAIRSSEHSVTTEVRSVGCGRPRWLVPAAI